MTAKHDPWKDVRYDRAGRPLDDPDISNELWEEMKAEAAAKHEEFLAAALALFPDKRLNELLALAKTPVADRLLHYDDLRDALALAIWRYHKPPDKRSTLKKKRQRFSKIKKHALELVRTLKDSDEIRDSLAEAYGRPTSSFWKTIRAESDVDVIETVALIQHAAEEAIAEAEREEPLGKRADKARLRLVEDALKVFVKVSPASPGGSPTSVFADFAREFFGAATNTESPDNDYLMSHIRAVVKEYKARPK
jgi:hypothetical protein